MQQANMEKEAAQGKLEFWNFCVWKTCIHEQSNYLKNFFQSWIKQNPNRILHQDQTERCVQKNKTSAGTLNHVSWNSAHHF